MMVAMPAASFIVGLLVGIVLVVAALLAVYRHLRRSRKGLAPVNGYLDLIPDLSQEQRERVQTIRQVFLPKVEGIRQCLYRQRNALAELLFAEPADRPAIAALMQDIIHYQSQLEHEVIQHILEEKELLTDAQKRRFHGIILDQFATGGLGVHDVKGRQP